MFLFIIILLFLLLCKSNDQTTQCPEEYIQFIGDGLCHGDSNNEECGWDGGDCCESTCIGDDCGLWGYTCLDPSINFYPNCNVYNVPLIGDGL